MEREKAVYVPTAGEEIANVLSHGVMALAMLAALPFAAVWAYTHDPEGVRAAFSVSVFVISVFLMFLVSTLYHAMRPASRHKGGVPRARPYLHLRGHRRSYTPVALSVIGGWQGLLIAGLQWAMVVFGIFYKSLSHRSIPAVSLTIYLVMGWAILLFLPLFVRRASTELLALIALGGVLLYARGGDLCLQRGSAITIWCGIC